MPQTPESSGADESPTWLRTRLFVPLLVAIVAAVYANALSVGFTSWDDPLYVLENARVKDSSLSGLRALWSPRPALEGAALELFPLRDSVYWALHATFGLDPRPFHAANIACHLAACLLVWALALRIGFPRFVAAGTALLFAVHPEHVESVTWIAGLKDPLYFCFTVASVLAYIGWRESGRPLLYGASLALLVLGLLCKSLALVTPGLLLAWEVSRPGPRPSVRTLLPRLALHAIVAVAFTALFVTIGQRNDVVVPLHGGTLPRHAFFAGWAFALYVAKAFAPTSSRLYYCFTLPGGLTDPRVLCAALVPLAAVAALAWSWRASRTVFFLIAWFVLCLLPVLNIVPFPALLADRYLYAPTFASCAAIALLCHRLSPPLRTPLLAAIVGVMGLVVVVWNQAWHDETRLWLQVARDPECADTPLPLLKLSELYVKANRLPEALLCLEKATALPRFRLGRNDIGPRMQAEKHALAAWLAQTLGQPATARRHARAALGIDPMLVAGWEQLAQAEWASGDIPAALRAAERAVVLAPTASNRWDRALIELELRPAEGQAAAREIAEIVEKEPVPWCARWSAWRDARPGDAPARRAVDAAVGDRCAATISAARPPGSR